jgi:aminoglycoside phosphotransferase
VSSPDLALLTGPEAHGLLAAAVATAGGELVSWRVGQVDHRPGAGTTASYRARVRWGDRELSETLGASTGMAGLDPVPGVLALSDGEQEVAVWRFPLDPALPALPSACDTAQMAVLLRELGVPAEAADGLAVRVRSYRPRRRAVVEVAGARARLFVKVLRPDRVEELHRRHTLLHAAGLPVPRSLGWTREGLLVLEPLVGGLLRSALRDPAAALPSVAEATALLDRLPPEVMDLSRRQPWTAGADHYASVIGAALPDEKTRAEQLARDVLAATAGQEADVPTHGDFYDAQILVEGDRISGLLDVDTTGPGRRADDLACLVAHAEVLGTIDTAHRSRLRRQARDWARDVDTRVDPRELRARVAGVLLSLATGPHRVQEPGWAEATSARLDLVEHWLGWPGDIG